MGEPRAVLSSGQIDCRRPSRDFQELQRLVPGNPDVVKLRAALRRAARKYAEAAASLREAVEKEPDDVEAAYFLAQLVKKEQNPETDAEYQRLMEQILAVHPGNRLALRERLLTAARRSDLAAVKDTLARIQPQEADWTVQREEIRSLFAKLKEAAAAARWDEVNEAIHPFANLFIRPSRGSRTVRRSWDPRKTIAETQCAPSSDLRRSGTPPPPLTPNSRSFKRRLRTHRKTNTGILPCRCGSRVHGSPTVVFLANAKELRALGSPACCCRPYRSPPTASFRLTGTTTFAPICSLVGLAGLLFYQQEADGNFTDVTAKTTLPPEVLKGDYTAALAADVDLDGDLDILLARRTGPPVLLRNNLDGTFTALPIVPEVDGARAFAWADFDHDGAPDLPRFSTRVAGCTSTPTSGWGSSARGPQRRRVSGSSHLRSPTPTTTGYWTSSPSGTTGPSSASVAGTSGAAGTWSNWAGGSHCRPGAEPGTVPSLHRRSRQQRRTRPDRRFRDWPARRGVVGSGRRQVRAPWRPRCLRTSSRPRTSGAAVGSTCSHSRRSAARTTAPCGFAPPARRTTTGRRSGSGPRRASTRSPRTASTRSASAARWSSAPARTS